MTQHLVEPTDLGVLTAKQALRHTERQLAQGDARARTWRTGFTPLDAHLDGGIHAGDLALLAGAQGTGKTTMALQMARNVCAAGGRALYVCFEHTPALLVEKLIAMEAALAAGPAAPSHEELRRELGHGGRDLVSAVGHLPGALEGLAELERYGDRLRLVGARGDVNGIDDLRSLASATPEPGLLVVDYLQKMYGGDVADEDLRVSRIATALKDMALELSCPVLAVTAVDRTGLDAARIRARHLKGSVTLAYEADLIMVLQEKYDLVERQHLVYDLVGAEEHHRWVVCSLEKNRHGRDNVDLEFRKRLSHGHLDPHGRVVQERLVSERLSAT